MMTTDDILDQANDLETILTRTKEKIISQIIAQGADDEARRKIRALFVKLNETESAIQAIVYKYVACSRPIDAITQYLADTQRAQTKTEIVQGVLRGKFRGGGQEQTSVVQAAVGVFTSPDATGTKGKNVPIRMKNGLIGLKDWPDERFDDPPR